MVKVKVMGYRMWAWFKNNFAKVFLLVTILQA